jgi:hypothetical protein
MTKSSSARQPPPAPVALSGIPDLVSVAAYPPRSWPSDGTLAPVPTWERLPGSSPGSVVAPSDPSLSLVAAAFLLRSNLPTLGRHVGFVLAAGPAPDLTVGRAALRRRFSREHGQVFSARPVPPERFRNRSPDRG